MRVALLHLRTQRQPSLEWFQVLLDALNDVAIAAVEELGWQPTLIAAGEQPVDETLAQATDHDAIVIMGGEDVAPEFYGGPAEYPGSGHHERLADEAQIAVVRRAVADSIPLLGLCRGTQVINVALGGTLIQHLPQDGAHRIAGPQSLELVPVKPTYSGDLAATLDPEIPVWCGHHQAIGRLADGLTPVAIAPDGVIEGVVHESAPLTGVQWHPEHRDAAPSQLRALLQRLER